MFASLIVTLSTVFALLSAVASSSPSLHEVLTAAVSKKEKSKLKSFADILSSKEGLTKFDLADTAGVAPTTATGYVSYNIYSDTACTTLFAAENVFASGQCIPYTDSVNKGVSAKINFDPTQAISATSVYYVTYYTGAACTGTASYYSGFTSLIYTGLSSTCSTTQGLLIDGVNFGSGKLVFSATNTATSFGTPNVLETTYSGTVCTNAAYAVGYEGATANCVASGTASAAVQQTCSSGVCGITLNTFSGTSCSGTPTILIGAFTKILNTCAGGISEVVGSTSSLSVFNAAPSSSSSSTCFSGSSEVTMESGAVKQISDVVVGDRVLSYSSKTQSAVFSNVVAVPHAKNNKVAEFVQITTESGKIVKMTSEHLIQSCEGLVAASKIASGSCVVTVNGQENVFAVEKVVEEGLYTVVAGEDLVVVNGVVASPFAVNHFIPNMFYNFHRMLFGLLPNFLSTKMMDSVATVADEVAQYYTVAADSL